MAPRVVIALFVLAALGGCRGGARAASAPERVPPSPDAWIEDLASDRMLRHTLSLEGKATRQRAQAVALAAYMFEGDRMTATLEDMIDRSEDPYALKARGQLHDVWGRKLRLHYTSERRTAWDVVVTSAGPDGRFDTRDDVQVVTSFWQ
jgi:hypothetical protein